MASTATQADQTFSKRKPRTIRAPHGEGRPYFMMRREPAQDRQLSWEARGVMAYILSKPDDWEIKIADLEQKCSSARVYRILNELIAAGYVEREAVRNKRGKIIEWVYRTRELPLLKNQEVENQQVDNPEVENPFVENQDAYIKQKNPQNTESSQKKDSLHPAAGASDATGAPDAPDKAVEPEAKRESTDAKQPTAVKERIEEPTPSSAAPLPAAALVTASKKTKAEKPKSDLPPASTDVKNMIALECYGTVKAWDYPQNATAMMKAYKDCKAPTVDQLKAHQRWWNVNDFRGRKGQRPKPHQVAETWAEFLVSQEGSTNGNTNASPVHANAFRVPKGFGGRKD